MNVLLCATCGTRLTEPVRRLDEMPGYPGRYGLPGPLRFGAPFGVNHVCRCGAEVAIVAVDCTSGYETRLGRVAKVPPPEGGPPAARRLARSPGGGTPIAAPGDPRTTSARASARHAESTLPHPRTELRRARAGGIPTTPPGPPSGRTTGLSQHALVPDALRVEAAA